MQIKIKLEPTFSIKWPKLRIYLNDDILYDDYCSIKGENYFTWIHDLDESLLKDQNLLTIEHYDKDGKETIIDSQGETMADRALILKSISINNLEVPEVVLFDKPFYISYTDKQMNEPGEKPSVLKNNLYFGYNGKYVFTFSDNAEKDYYKHLLTKEKLANIANKKVIVSPDGNLVEVFEFVGKMVDGSQEQSISIDELYNQVKNAD